MHGDAFRHCLPIQASIVERDETDFVSRIGMLGAQETQYHGFQTAPRIA